MGGGKRLRRQIELMIADQAGAVDQRACAGRRLGGGQERVPDRPGVDRAALERGARIGRRQVHGLDVGIGEARRLQRPHQQVLDVRALVERDLAALQAGDVGHREVLRDQDRLARRCGRLVADIEQGRAGGLGEDRRRLAGGAEVDGADVQRLQQLRAARELGPGDRPAFRRQPLLQQAALLEQHQRAVLLEADPQHLVGGERRQRQAQARCRQTGQPHQVTSLHHDLRHRQCELFLPIVYQFTRVMATAFRRTVLHPGWAIRASCLTRLRWLCVGRRRGLARPPARPGCGFRGRR